MSGNLSGLKTLQDYGSEREHIFPSKTSLSWFVRRHKTELVDAGALLMIAGRWYVDPDKFDSYVLAAASKAAATQIARGS